MSLSVATGKMHAGLYYAPGEVRYEETAIPLLESGEILVAIDTALTCGTDVKCYRRGHPVLLKEFPSPFGHEFAGTVVDVADDVPAFKRGDRVVAANSAPCYDCFFCERQQYNLCEHLELLNGAYADFLKIPAGIVRHNTYLIPAHVSFETAAFCEPLADALRGVAVSDIQAGEHVAVMGLGPIGQFLVKAAKQRGAIVTAFGRSDLKLALAKRFGGADALVSMSGQSPEAYRSEYSPQGRGFDVVIEAIGKPETWELALSLVRRGGRVNWYGGCPAGSTVSIDTRRLHYDEITINSPFHHTPAYFKAALEAIASGAIDPTPLITAVMPMAAFEEALLRMEAGEVLKVALKNESCVLDRL